VTVPHGWVDPLRLPLPAGSISVAVARVGALAEEIRGNQVRAGRWLRERNLALGGSPPIHWLDTDIGAKEVEELLIRIAHGVHS